MPTLPKPTDSLTIGMMVEVAHKTALQKGWWDGEEENPRNFGEQIALMHSELSEALEAARTPVSVGEEALIRIDTGETGLASEKIPGFFAVEEEFADVLIRIADTCGRYGYDLEGAVKEKLRYNANRSHKHGGKKF